MSDQSNILNTVFTSDVTNAIAGIRALLLELSKVDPVSKNFNDRMTKSTSVLGDFLKKADSGSDVFNNLGQGLSDIVSKTKETVEVLAKVIVPINAIPNVLNKASKEYGIYASAVDLVNIAYKGNETALKGVLTELDLLIGKNSKAGISIKEGVTAFKLADEAIWKYRFEIGKTGEATDSLRSKAELLGIGLTGVRLRVSDVGMALSIVGDDKTLLNALVALNEQVPFLTTKLIESTVAVYAHLQAVSSAEDKYGRFIDAAYELVNPLTIAKRAIQLTNEEIGLMKGGFIGLVPSVQIGGAVLTNTSSVIRDLTQNLLASGSSFDLFRNFFTNIPGIIAPAILIVRDFFQISEGSQLKAGINNLVEWSSNFQKIQQVLIGTSSQLQITQKDIDLLTEAYFNNAQIQSVLQGETATTLDYMYKLGIAATSGTNIAKELGYTYSGLSERIAFLGETYGKAYAEFLEWSKTLGLTNDQMLGLSVSVENYAKISEGLIEKQNAVTQSAIEQAKSVTALAGDHEKMALVVQALNERNTEFASTMRSQEAIMVGVTNTTGDTAQKLLTYEQNTFKAKKAAEEFAKASANLSTANEKVGSSSGGAASGIGSVGNAASTAGAKAKGAAGFFDSLFNTLKNFIVFQLASSIVSGFVQSITAAISTTMEFDQILHNLQAITGSTSVEMAGMGDTIKKMASSSIYDIKEIGSSLQIMAQAGLSAGESVSVIKSAVDLATGTFEKLENTVDLITSTMSSYQINVIESGRVSDILAIAVNQSKLSIDKLRTSLNYVGVIAAQSGLSLEQTSASLMVLADRGMKASTIGTGFRQVLDKLISPNEKLRDAYQSHGIALEKISPLTAGYEEALKNLSIALWDSNTKTVDTAKAFELFGIRGAQAAAILIQAYTTGEWKDAMKSFDQSGVAAKMAAEQMEGLGAKWENLKAKASVLLATIGEGGLTTVLKGLTDLASGAIQVFLDMKNGMDSWGFGANVVRSSIASLIVVFGGAIALMTTWGTLSAYAATTGTFLNTVVVSLVASFKALTVAMMTNPLVAFGVAIASAVAIGLVYKDQLAKLIESHNKLANEASQTANVIELFGKVLEKSKDDPVQYAVNLNRLKSEYPDLVKQILKLTGTIDLADLSFQKLQDAMSKIKQAKLKTALEESGKALVALGPLLDEASHKGSLLGQSFDEMSKKNKASNEKIRDQWKLTASAAVAMANNVGGAFEDQKDIALKALDDMVAGDKRLAASRDEIAKLIVASLGEQKERLESTSKHYEKFSNEVSKVYADLSALERAEMQSVYGEQEKALEKFQKFCRDKEIALEERLAGEFAIEQLYYQKGLAALSDNRKKQGETDLDTYNRKMKLLEDEYKGISDNAEKQKQIYDNLKEFRYVGDKEIQTQLIVSAENAITVEKRKGEILREQANLTFEHNKKTITNLTNEIKSSISIQTSLLEAFEIEKLTIEQKGAELLLKTKQLQIEQEKERFSGLSQELQKSEVEQNRHQEFMRQLIAEEVALRGDAINKILASGKYWLERSNKLQEDNLTYIKDIYKRKQEMVQLDYEIEINTEKNKLERKLALIDKANRDESVVHDLQEKAKLKYGDEELKRALEVYDKKLELSRKEYEETQNVLQEKLRINEEYVNSVKTIYAAESAYAKVTEEQKLNAYARSLDARNATMKQETEMYKSEGGKRIQNRIDEMTLEGISVDQQVQKYGIAYEKITALQAKELKKQGQDVISTADGFYAVLTKKTSAVGKAATEETKLHKDGLKKQDENTAKFVDEQIKYYEAKLAAIVKEINAEEAAQVASINRIKKLKEDQLKLSESFDEDIRQAKQTTMTDEQKYADNAKEIDRRLNLAKTTGLMEHITIAKSLINSEVKSYSDANGKILLNEKDAQSKQIALLQETKKISEDITSKQVAKEDELMQKREESLKKQSTIMDETKKKIEEFQELQVTLELTKFNEATTEMKKGITEIIDALNGIKGKAPVDIDILLAKTKISDIINVINGVIPVINKIKETPIEILIKSGGTGLVEALGIATTSLQTFKEFIGKEIKPELPIGIMGSISTDAPKPFSEALSGAETLVGTFKTNLNTVNPSISVSIQGQNSAEEKPKSLSEAITEANLKISTIGKFKDAFSPEILLKFKAYIDKAQENSRTLGEVVDVDIPNKLTELKTNAEKQDIKTSIGFWGNLGQGLVTFIDAIAAIIDQITNKIPSEKTVVINVVTKYTSEGTPSSETPNESSSNRTGGFISSRVGGFIQNLRTGEMFSGKLPGYGGGDIVNAKLEPGEFVLRKEAVKQIGVNALRQWNNLNSEALKSINPQSGSRKEDSMFTGQLHTINLNIGGESHQMFAQPNVLNSLVSSLRRTRLMTA